MSCAERARRNGGDRGRDARARSRGSGSPRGGSSPAGLRPGDLRDEDAVFRRPGGLADETCPEGCQMRGARSGTGGARGRTSKLELLVGVNLEAVRHRGRRSRAGSLASSASVREFVAPEGRAACRKGTSRRPTQVPNLDWNKTGSVITQMRSASSPNVKKSEKNAWFLFVFTNVSRLRADLLILCLTRPRCGGCGRRRWRPLRGSPRRAACRTATSR